MTQFLSHKPIQNPKNTRNGFFFTKSSFIHCSSVNYATILNE